MNQDVENQLGGAMPDDELPRKPPLTRNEFHRLVAGVLKIPPALVRDYTMVSVDVAYKAFEKYWEAE